MIFLDFNFLEHFFDFILYIKKKKKRFCPWWGLNTQPCESDPTALSTEPSCLLISSNISHFLLYVIWNRKSALRSLNQEKSKKFFLILKLEIIPHRNPLRRKNNHRKCQKEVLYTICFRWNFYLRRRNFIDEITQPFVFATFYKIRVE